MANPPTSYHSQSMFENFNTFNSVNVLKNVFKKTLKNPQQYKAIKQLN